MVMAAALSCMLAAVQAQPIHVDAQVDKDRIALGDPFTLTISIEHPSLDTYALPAPVPVAPLTLRGPPQVSRTKSGDHARTTFTIPLTDYRTLEPQIPALTFAVDGPDGPREFTLPPQPLELRSLVAEERAPTLERAHHGPKQPVPVVVRSFLWAFIAGAVVLAAVALYAWSRYRKYRAALLAAPAPPPTPEDEAMGRLSSLKRRARPGCAGAVVRRVDPHRPAGLCISHRPQAGQTCGRERLLDGIGDHDGNHVVPARADGESRLVSLGEEVADEEYHRAPAEQTREISEDEPEIGAVARGLEGERLRDEAQSVLAAPARRNVALDAVGEEEDAGAVAVLQRAEDEERRDLRCHLRLDLGSEADVLRGAAVHGDERGELALLDEHLDERLSDPRRHVPIDGANLVAGLVRAHFAEGHAASLEDRVVPAGEGVEHRAPGGDLDPADLADEVRGGRHYGTSIFSRIRCTIFSLVRFSASAS